MERKSLVLTFILLSIFASISLKSASSIFSASGHLLISEVQISGSSSTDEFVEIYNPTGISVDMTGWRLTKSSSTGTEANLVASLSGTLVSGQHLLIAHPDYDGAVSPDILYSAASNSIPSNGAVSLYSDAGTTLVDQVGFGSGVIFETQSVDNPQPDGSAQRTPQDSDTDNNFTDFTLALLSDPQNSASQSATPTEESSPTPTETPTESPTSTPIEVPTETPTQIPTQTPTQTPEPEHDDKEDNETHHNYKRHHPKKSHKKCTVRFEERRFGRFKFYSPRLVWED